MNLKFKINGCTYIVSDSPNNKIVIPRPDLSWADPMYNKTSEEYEMYRKFLKQYNPLLHLQMTYEASYNSNDPYANPSKIEELMNGTGYAKRMVHYLKKYNFKNSDTVNFGKKSHGKHYPPNDTDLIMHFMRRDEILPDFWNLNHLENSRILSRYVKDFNPKNAFKPKSMYSDFLKTYTRKNSWIVDLNACSGNLLTSAIKLKRNCLAIEENPDMFDKLVEKLKKY